MKHAARLAARAALARVLPAEALAWSAEIAARVQNLEAFGRAKMVACYLALPQEVQTAPLLAACRRLGQRVCVPAYDERAGCYRLAWLTANDVLVAGRWQVPEPVEPQWVGESATVDAVIVPGLAFDRQGRRLGRGGGGFDRLLEKLPAYKIGIAFEAQLVASVPTEIHDIPMDAVVTEKEIYLRAEEEARK